LVPPQALRAGQAANAVNLNAERGRMLGVAHSLVRVHAEARLAERFPTLSKGALSDCRQLAGPRGDRCKRHPVVHDHGLDVPRPRKGGAPSNLRLRPEGDAGVLQDALVRTHADVNCIDVPHDHRSVERHHPRGGLGGLTPLGAKALRERLRRLSALEVTKGALDRHRVGEGSLVRDHEGGEHIRQVIATNAKLLVGPKLKLQKERTSRHVLRGATQVKLPSIPPTSIGDHAVRGLILRDCNMLKAIRDFRRERQGELATDVPAAAVLDYLSVNLRRRVRGRLFPHAALQLQQTRILPARGLKDGKIARRVEP
jgi:hypothetical protein